MKKIDFSTQVPIRYNADVVVCGGGPAGMTAAIAAAREGARVLLVERGAFLGGNLTAGLVNPMMTFHAEDGTQVIRGIAEEFVQRLVSAGGSPGHVPDPVQFVRTVTPFQPEVFKYVAEQMARESGVELLYHSLVSGVVRHRDRIDTVVVVNKSGFEGIQGRVYVDASGDGDLCALAGEECHVGRDEDGLTQPMTMMFHVAGIEWEPIMEYMEAHAEDFRPVSPAGLLKRIPVPGLAGFFKLVEEGAEEGLIPAVRDRVLLFGTGEPGEAILNVTRLLYRSGLDAMDLTEVEIDGRQQMWAFARFLRTRVPGFANMKIVQSGSRVGVRETRRVRGEYVIKAEDLLDGKVFGDTVAYGSYPIDIHSPVGGSLRTEKAGKLWYGIPLRALTPLHNSNLVVAGRCISATHVATAAIRVSPIAMGIGEAAGRLAAIAAKKRVQAKAVDVEDVRGRLELLS